MRARERDREREREGEREGERERERERKRERQGGGEETNTVLFFTMTMPHLPVRVVMLKQCPSVSSREDH